MPEYVVGRRTTVYEAARRLGRFEAGGEEAEFDVFEATQAAVIELAQQRRRPPA